MEDNTGYSREDWQKHYNEGDLRWDLEEVSPPFVHLWEEKRIHPCRMLIPGCGRGHEVLFFAKQGFDVTAVDFAPGAVERLNHSLNEKGVRARVLNLDFFELPVELNGQYDLILEQTFFCAICLEDRPRYVQTAHRMLKPNGRMVALFYETGEEGGPPFNTPPDQIRVQFSKYFMIEKLGKTPHSAERRKEKEWLSFLRKI